MSHSTLTLAGSIAETSAFQRGTLLGLLELVTVGLCLPGVLTDANRHKVCLVLAITGTLMMCALAADRIHQDLAVFDMPAFKASKPPLLDLTVEPMRGPRV